ncbi:MAG: hypothetical protein M3Q56_03390 [Bacteroidota bacterium]|nr:hypothetical protein [Bacteroidota bacterium]
MKKSEFLRNELMNHLRSIPYDTQASWGKMNVHQMIEHLSDSLRIANGKDIHTAIFTQDERIEKYRAFIFSDTPFKENTKNILLPEIPLPIRHQDVKDSLTELENEIQDFFTTFEKNPEQTFRNPFFGDLNYEQWSALFYKHAIHHFKQFGISV